jgi:uncharacterized HAD superfamily protein
MNSRQLKILCDIDNVLAQFTPTFLEAYNKWQSTKWQPEDITDYDFSRLFGLADQDVAEFQAFFAGLEMGGLYRNLIPMEDAALGISYLRGHGCEINLITRRHSRFERETILWILHCNISYQYLIHCDSKLDHLHNVDILIEDEPETALRAAKQGVTVLLFDQPYNRKLPNGKLIDELDVDNLRRVQSWREIMNFVRELKSYQGSPRTDRRGITRER